MAGKKITPEVLAEKVAGRKEVLKKHLEAGKDRTGDVLKRDRKLLKRAARRLKKLTTRGRKAKKAQ
ncbi:MAG: hypothetical protein JW909_08825 [Planctomycetes bacterium]|nr:hypothetical protein [Planctomycetota bacterium]